VLEFYTNEVAAYGPIAAYGLKSFSKKRKALVRSATSRKEEFYEHGYA
jgi:hypothetical protein